MHVCLNSSLVTGNILNTNNGINKVTTKCGKNKFLKRSEMNMGFGKSFGLGLVVYLLLNLGMSVVVQAITAPDLIGAMFTSVAGIFGALLGPVLLGYMAFMTLATSTFTLTVVFTAILLIVPGLIGAIVAGKSSDSAGAAFGGWLLAPIVTGVILAVLALVIPEMAFYGLFGILYPILAGVSVGFLWGGIAAVMAGP